MSEEQDREENEGFDWWGVFACVCVFFAALCAFVGVDRITDYIGDTVGEGRAIRAENAELRQGIHQLRVKNKQLRFQLADSRLNPPKVVVEHNYMEVGRPAGIDSTEWAELQKDLLEKVLKRYR
jgi:hypothetical protein